MGTKAHPGKFDCYTTAQPHEPLFTLLGRDPLAHYLVALWALLRSGAFSSINDLVLNMQRRASTLTNASPEKLMEAVRCSDSMAAYYYQEPYCHVCLCTENNPCTTSTPIGPQPCSWSNSEKTVCTRAECVTAATFQVGNDKQ